MTPGGGRFWFDAAPCGRGLAMAGLALQSPASKHSLFGLSAAADCEEEKRKSQLRAEEWSSYDGVLFTPLVSYWNNIGKTDKLTLVLFLYLPRCSCESAFSFQNLDNVATATYAHTALTLLVYVWEKNKPGVKSATSRALAGFYTDFIGIVTADRCRGRIHISKRVASLTTVNMQLVLTPDSAARSFKLWPSAKTSSISFCTCGAPRWSNNKYGRLSK